MESLVGVIWEVLTAAGGTLALTLIVVIALGISALGLLFFGSAVIALEHFARAVRRWQTLVAVGLVWSGVLAAAALYITEPELAEQPFREYLGRWALSTAAAAGMIVAVVLALRVLFASFRSRQIATVSLLLLGFGYALVVGGTDRVVYAVAPAGFALALTLLLAWRRSRRDPDASTERSEGERLSALLVVSLLVGVAVALVSNGPKLDVTTAGATLLGVYGGIILVGLLPLAAAGLIDMRGSAEWFIALRYLTAKRRQTFISVITGICVVGIAAGVWLIITVLSVMNGFERTWREEIIGNRAHVTVHHTLGPFADYAGDGGVIDRVSRVEGVVAVSPVLDAEGMVRGPGGRILGVRVRGIDATSVATVTDLKDDIVAGSLAALEPEAQVEGDDPAIVVGSQLAASVGAEVGETLMLISPFGGPQTPLGPAPRLTRFRVVGIFESSFFQYDEMFTFVNLNAAQNFRRTGDVIDGIEVRTTNFYRSRGVGDAIEAELGFPYYTRDWKDFFPAFFQALRSERIMMFTLLTMILVVATFSIVATLVMMIMEKSSDIAILKTMGARDAAIERVFAIEGTLIGLVGTSLGVIAGVSVTRQISWVQSQIESIVGFDALPASIYQFQTLPAELDASQIAVAVGLAMVLSLGATLLPSRQGARLDPVEALRYE
jgi:lipoprotein-releasing system permease protein